MKLIRDPKKLQQILQKERARGKSVGFIPTMGALHEGHLSLVRASSRENDVTVVSIFVNPTQFGLNEDFSKYPRVLRTDIKMLRTLKADYLFCPSVSAMYPEGYATFVDVSPRLANVLCGKFRPGHFRGVATVVVKLLNITGPCRLYLGAKDFQQVTVISQLVRDLNMKTQVRVMPTVREKDGLAMSSRNRFLSPGERDRALTISRVLFACKKNLLREKMGFVASRRRALSELKRSVERVQYFEIVDPRTLAPVKKYQEKMAVLTACFVGKTRLIDNVIIRNSDK
ncbi:MAG: pantoate--beta-alanine ligase [Omnitrophica bacterium RIFOXYB12_FULL_50_7]|nr:MAG: pantoate--beta-alanine ligase [Omnitrophica bacterium RIFOXYB12_FULL_50_7]